MRSDAQSVLIQSRADNVFAFVFTEVQVPGIPDELFDRCVETVDHELTDAAALDQLVRSVQDDVYALAIRMLWDPHDA
jgi:hypothetical protein